MLHLFTDGFTLGQVLAYLTGVFFIAATIKRSSRRIQVSIPVRVKDEEKSAE